MFVVVGHRLEPVEIRLTLPYNITNIQKEKFICLM